eukprot:TRINITY_DN111208_c0_g1_i1.p1 TRINITY_DN111208_c0_g1~~TRINITY_DN111208_c0_g1_i1.p1  ORF type:complete len:199 (-),score=47.50 TRINITY_DN111208_c0_g1_i1:288-884(-)
MARLSFAMLAAACATTGRADDGRQLVGDQGRNAALQEYPRNFCKKFTITGMPLKTRVLIKGPHAADIQATVSGFTLSCLNQKIGFGEDGRLLMEDSDDKKGPAKDCVEQQFLNMGADFSDLKIVYNRTTDGLNLYSTIIGNGKVVLEAAEECKNWKFDSSADLGDDDDDFGDDWSVDSMRRLLAGAQVGPPTRPTIIV